MRLLLGLVCDSASQDREGRVHVRGQYHDLYASGFPAKHDLTLVVVLEWPRSDQGRYTFTVELMGPDGRPSLRGEGYTEVVAAPADGPPARTTYIQPLADVVFPVPGEYRFRVRAKGVWHEGPLVYLWRNAAGGGGAAEA
jgi:hypothetical protein